MKAGGLGQKSIQNSWSEWIRILLAAEKLHIRGLKMLQDREIHNEIVQYKCNLGQSDWVRSWKD